MSVAIDARIRHGAPPDWAKLPWMGCTAGIRISTEDDVAELWQTITEIRRRRAAYLGTNGLPDEHAAIARLGDAPPPGDDGLGFGDGTGYDLRDDAERERAADAAWSAVIDALWPISPLAVRYIEQVVIQDQDIPGPLPMLLRAIGKAI